MTDRQIQQISEQYRGVVVFASGGVDSTALLRFLWRLTKPKKYFELAVFHANFGLRDKDSELDQMFCEDLARAHDATFFGRKCAYEGQGEGIQEWARDVRRAAAQDLHKEGWIAAFAHHAGDVAENALMRMARGTAPGTMAGMTEWTPPFWRPFLSVPKAALAQFLAEEGIPHRVDRSNDTIDYTRNLIRNKVLPELEALYPGATERIAACAREAADLAALAKAATCSTRRTGTQAELPIGSGYGHFIGLASDLRKASGDTERMLLLTNAMEQAGVRARQLSRRWLLDVLQGVTTLGTPAKLFARDIPGGGRVLARGDDIVVEARSHPSFSTDDLMIPVYT